VAGWTQCSVKSLQATCVHGTASVPHEAPTIQGNDDALPVHNLLTGYALCVPMLARAPDS
jgi:hypothetical protein